MERAVLNRGKWSWDSSSKQSPLEKLRVWSTVAFHWVGCDSFLLAELLKEEEEVFFVLGSVIFIGVKSFPVWHPDYLKWDFLLLFLDKFLPFDQDCSLKASLIESQVFWFQWLFIPQGKEGHSWMYCPTSNGNCTDLKPIDVHIWITGSCKKENAEVLIMWSP